MSTWCKRFDFVSVFAALDLWFIDEKQKQRKIERDRCRSKVEPLLLDNLYDWPLGVHLRVCVIDHQHSMKRWLLRRKRWKKKKSIIIRWRKRVLSQDNSYKYNRREFLRRQRVSITVGLLFLSLYLFTTLRSGSANFVHNINAHLRKICPRIVGVAAHYLFYRLLIFRCVDRWRTFIYGRTIFRITFLFCSSWIFKRY